MKANRFVSTEFARAAVEELHRLDRAPRRRTGSCSIALLSAPSGAGITTAAHEFCTVRIRPHIRVPHDPSPRTLLNKIFKAAAGFEESYWGGDQTREKILSELADQGAPLLFFDDCERLTPKLLDLIRDIGDASGSPIALAVVRGGRGLLQTLRAPRTALLQQIAGRVEADIELPAPSLADARVLAEELCEIALEPELIAHIHMRGAQSVRRLLADFERAETIAAATAAPRLDLATWCELTGDAPLERALPEPRKAITAAKKTAVQAAVNSGSRAA